MPGESVILRFKRVTDRAFAPVRGSEKAAGVDLKSAYKVTVPAKGKALCETDLQVAIPNGYYGRVAPRSGLALKHGIDVGGCTKVYKLLGPFGIAELLNFNRKMCFLAGVIDEDYRGNVGVILFNHSETDFEINEGDRIAQLICERICYPELMEVNDLDSTERGRGGFGSTGKN